MMKKTMLGIPASLLAALVCLLGYYGGYVVAALIVGYVLLMEENTFVKRMACKVMALLLAFSMVSTAIYLLPNMLTMIHSLIRVFAPNVYVEELYSNFLTRLAEFLSSVLSLGKTVLFLLMGLMAFFDKELKIPVLDKMMDRYMKLGKV